MTDIENSQELADLKAQLNILKLKLERQTIINDEHIRTAMKGKMSWIRRYIWIELLVILPLCILDFVFLKFMIPNMSWAPIIAILVFLAIQIGLDFYINRINDNDLENENLVATSLKLVRMKRARWIQVAVSLPIAVALFAWFSSYFEGPQGQAMTYGMYIGGVIGFCVGIGILVRMNRTNDQLVKQINLLLSDK